MKQKRILALVISAVMLMIMLPSGIASASEIVLFDDTFNNTYATDGLDINWWGNPGQDAKYAAGERWAINWGGTGAYRDAEDGSLAVIRGLNSSGNPISGETQTGKKIIADAIADNSTLEITYEFRTPDNAPSYSGADVWFRFTSVDPSGKSTNWSPFTLKISGAGLTHNWAITQFYPNGTMSAIGKTLDRDPDMIDFEWGKDYTVKITLKPSLEGSEYYRFVTEVWEDGSKIGTGIINEWNWITSDVIKTFTRADLNVITNDPITVEQEPEDLLYLKSIKLKAIQPDVPLNVTYLPTDGSVDAAVDTDCYAEFESAVNPVSASQVTVDGGASVVGVTMGNDNKRVNIELDGVVANTAYTVEIKNVKGVNADSAFDYKWTFTTDGGVEFGEPYFGISSTELDAAETGIDAANAVALDNAAYLNGEAWGTDDLTDAANSFVFADNALSIRSNTDNSVDNLSYRFEPVRDGGTLKLTAKVRIQGYGDYTVDTPKLGQMATMRLTGDGADRTVIGYNEVTYGHWCVNTLSSNLTNDKWSVNANDTNVALTGKGRYSTSAAWADISKNDGIKAQWNHANSGKNWNYFDGTMDVVFTAAPNADGVNYDLTLDLDSDRIDATATTTVPKAEVLAMDTVTFRTNGQVDVVREIMKVTDLKIETTFGKTVPAVGMSAVNIDYTNLSGAAFDADVLIVERDGETGEIVNATIAEKQNPADEAGTMTCEFEIMQAGGKLDIYVLNDADGMILLSGGKTFDVEQ